MKLSKKDNREIGDLIDICKKYQGEALPSHHGSGSWATTYSTRFVNASVKMYKILKDNGCQDTCEHMALLFRHNSIKSCRGSVFTDERFFYFYRQHLCYKVNS